MLKFLFGRYSRFVRLLEWVGLGLALLAVIRQVQAGHWHAPEWLLVLLLLQYAFVRVCHGINWYPEATHRRTADPQLGIEVHFLKALVPTSYILSIAMGLFLFGLEWTAMILANLMLFVVTGVNGILITFHRRDDRRMPVNYFTRNLYLEDEGRSESSESMVVTRREVSAA